MRMISLVMPSKVTMMWSGTGGMFVSVALAFDIVDDVEGEGDGVRDESMFRRCVWRLFASG
tara:strand:+ start:745 stop:927 length:183 start_codon:yes stop_codon:yes gene_type:complete